MVKKIGKLAIVLGTAAALTGCSLGVEVPTVESEAEKNEVKEEIVLGGSSEEVAEDEGYDIAKVIASKVNSVDDAFSSFNLLDYDAIASDKEVNDSLTFPIYSSDLTSAELVKFNFSNEGLSYGSEMSFGSTLSYRVEGNISTKIIFSGINSDEATFSFSLVGLNEAQSKLSSCTSHYILGSNLGGETEDGLKIYAYLPYSEGTFLEVSATIAQGVENVDSQVFDILKNVSIENKGTFYSVDEYNAGVFKYLVGHDYIVVVSVDGSLISGESESDSLDNVDIPEDVLPIEDQETEAVVENTDSLFNVLSVNTSEGTLSLTKEYPQSTVGFMGWLSRVEDSIPSGEKLIDDGTTSWSGTSLNPVEVAEGDETEKDKGTTSDEGPKVIYAFTQVKTNSKAKPKDLSTELADFKGKVSVSVVGQLGNDGKYVDLAWDGSDEVEE